MSNNDTITTTTAAANASTSSQRPLQPHPWLMVRLSTSTVATGVFLSLSLWALCDMWKRKTIFLVKF